MAGTCGAARESGPDGLVHLKDMKVAADGSFDLPYCGKGEIDFELVLKLLKDLWRNVPFIIEHVERDDDILRAAEWVIRNAIRAGYDMS